MIDEQEIKGLDEDLQVDEQNFRTILTFEKLNSVFEDLDMFMPKHVINIILDYCKTGFAYIHTRDGGEFCIKKSALKLSELLKTQYKKFELIHVHKISKEAFSNIADYLSHHNGVKPAEIAKPVRSVKMSKIVEDEWDAKFANSMSKVLVFQVIHGADYIDCQSLRELLCAKVATLIKGKSPAEIQLILSENDEIVENIQTYQRESENQPICMCGHVWQEQENMEVKLEEGDQEVVEVQEEILELDERLSLD